MKNVIRFSICLLIAAACRSIRDESYQMVSYNVSYVDKPKCQTYVVNDVVVGDDITKLRKYLASKRPGSVRFQSSYKLTSSNVTKIMQLFHDLGFEIKQFWVPSSFPPGEEDLMCAENAPDTELGKEWIQTETNN